MTGKTRNLTLASSAVVMLAVAVWLFWSHASRRETLPSTFAINGVCLACKAEARVAIQAGEREPCVCPACGERGICVAALRRLRFPLHPQAGARPRRRTAARTADRHLPQLRQHCDRGVLPPGPHRGGEGHRPASPVATVNGSAGAAGDRPRRFRSETSAPDVRKAGMLVSSRPATDGRLRMDAGRLGPAVAVCGGTDSCKSRPRLV